MIFVPSYHTIEPRFCVPNIINLCYKSMILWSIIRKKSDEKERERDTDCTTGIVYTSVHYYIYVYV